MEQISKKEHFWPKTEKVIITIEFFLFELVLGLAFSLNWQFWVFGPNLPKKACYFQSKTYKIDTTIEFCIFKLVVVWTFTLNKQFWIFGLNLPKRDMVKSRRSEHDHWIPHIWISAGSKFQPKLTILIYWTRFAQICFFWSKTKKVNITK